MFVRAGWICFWTGWFQFKTLDFAVFLWTKWRKMSTSKCACWSIFWQQLIISECACWSIWEHKLMSRRACWSSLEHLLIDVWVCLLIDRLAGWRPLQSRGSLSHVILSGWPTCSTLTGGIPSDGLRCSRHNRESVITLSCAQHKTTITLNNYWNVFLCDWRSGWQKDQLSK